MSILRAAVAGLGRIGWEMHVRHIVEHAGFELVAVADILPERLEEAERHYHVPGFTELTALLRHTPALDLLVLASPTHLHAEQAIAAMEHGIDVFCDKPMAPTLADADRMIDAMYRLQRKLMVYQPHRVTAEATAARHILDGGLLGPLYQIKRTMSRYTRRNDWQALQRFGGGMLNNYGAHLIDQVLYLTDSTAKKIACHLRVVASLGDADDVVKTLIEMENDVVCDIEINMATAHALPAWHLMGQRGTAIFMPDEQAFHLRYYLDSELPPLELNTALAASERRYDNLDRIPWRDAVVLMAEFAPINYYDRVYEYFATGASPFVPIQETREVMRIIEACRTAAGWN